MLQTPTSNPEENISSKPITIYLTINKEELCDEGMQCLQIIESFDMGYFDPHNRGYIKGYQAIFYLRDLYRFNLDVTPEKQGQPIESFRHDKETLLAECAMQSILRKLYATGQIQEELISFQSRKGFPLDERCILSELISLKLVSHPKQKGCLFGKTVTHTYAYLSQGRLCIFFGDITEEQKQIFKNVFKTLFPEKNGLKSLAGPSQATAVTQLGSPVFTTPHHAAPHALSPPIQELSSRLRR